MRKMKKVFIFALFFYVLFFAFNAGVECQGPDAEKLIVGETKIFSTRAPTRVVIGNPAIADVGEVTNTEISVSGKAPGSTTLAYWDAFGEQSLKLMVIAEDMQIIQRRVDNLLKKLEFSEVYTKAEDEEGKILILGNIKTAAGRERIFIALGPLKDKVVDLMEVKEEQTSIEVDVQVLELDKGATDTLGFTWPGALNIIEKGSAGIAAAGTRWGMLFKILDVQRGTSAAADPFTLKIDFLIQEGKARILSRPRLVCQSGKEAQMLVGGEKPTFTTSVSTGGTSTSTVEYKEYGIKLKIKPTVTEDNRIKVALNVDVSDVGEAVTIGGTNSTGLAYPLTKRNASTELYLKDGQTLAIGGLIKRKSEETLRKVPWLADVPVLGAFFRQRTTTDGKGYNTKDDTELFITLTPTILGREKKEEPAKKEETKPEASPVRTAPSVSKIPLTPSEEYAAIIQRRIGENLVYPSAAKEAGFQGISVLSVRLSYLGKLLDVKIKDSSGYKILDDSALTAVQSISTFAPFPASIQQSELWVDVPVVFKID